MSSHRVYSWDQEKSIISLDSSIGWRPGRSSLFVRWWGNTAKEESPDWGESRQIVLTSWTRGIRKRTQADQLGGNCTGYLRLNENWKKIFQRIKTVLFRHRVYCMGQPVWGKMLRKDISQILFLLGLSGLNLVSMVSVFFIHSFKIVFLATTLF